MIAKKVHKRFLLGNFARELGWRNSNLSLSWKNMRKFRFRRFFFHRLLFFLLRLTILFWFFIIDRLFRNDVIKRLFLMFFLFVLDMDFGEWLRLWDLLLRKLFQLSSLVTWSSRSYSLRNGLRFYNFHKFEI